MIPAFGMPERMAGRHCICMLWVVCFTFAASAQSNDLKSDVRIHLRSEANCSSNTIKLADIADIQGSGTWKDTLTRQVLTAAPLAGKTTRLTRSDVENFLRDRGIESSQFRWVGSDHCVVKRASPVVRTRDDFVSLSPAPQELVQAQRNVERALFNYLQAQSHSLTQWKIQATFDSSHNKLLNQVRLIKGVAGGTSPWTGNQSFVILLRTPTGEEIEVPVQATVEAPPLVVAVKKTMRSGQPITDLDLQMIPLTSSARLDAKDCFTEYHELIGKEFKRSMSVGQVVSRSDIGPPRVINAGDAIELEILSGSVSIQTAAQSLEAGGMGDAIAILVLPQKKRIMATVVGERKVRHMATTNP